MLDFIIFILIFLFSAILHEISHGWVADYLGDPTARNAGRLTLNPIKHLDPMGSVILPLLLIMFNSRIIFGWAKPVPINPFNLRDKRFGEAKVAAAGPLSNVLIAVFFGLLIRFFPFGVSAFETNLVVIFGYIVWINLLLALFNLLPIPPLDGSHILFALLPPNFNELKVFLLKYGFFILLFFLFFFFQLLIPIIGFFFKIIVGQPFF
jgi:Zn-dependent protease